MYGGYPNSTMLFKNMSLLLETWKLFHFSSFSLSLFQAGIRVPIVLDISDMSNFFNTFLFT
jgi:hypothetical protein